MLKGSKVAKPEDPVRDGYTFAGWYADEALSEAYDFGSPVNKDTVLYAKWTEDGGSEQPEPAGGPRGSEQAGPRQARQARCRQQARQARPAPDG